VIDVVTAVAELSVDQIVSVEEYSVAVGGSQVSSRGSIDTNSVTLLVDVTTSV
jgi:hypothetical protein